MGIKEKIGNRSLKDWGVKEGQGVEEKDGKWRMKSGFGGGGGCGEGGMRDLLLKRRMR